MTVDTLTALYQTRVCTHRSDFLLSAGLRSDRNISAKGRNKISPFFIPETRTAIKPWRPHKKTLKQHSLFSWQFYESICLNTAIYGNVWSWRSKKSWCSCRFFLDVLKDELTVRMSWGSRNSSTTPTLSAPAAFVFGCSSGNLTCEKFTVGECLLRFSQCPHLTEQTKVTFE